MTSSASPAPTDPAHPLAGRRVGCLRRASETRNVGNFRWLEQERRLFEHIRALGGEPVLYDENEDGRGTSGRDLSKRQKALQLLADIDAGVLHDIGAFDIKRLTRDEFGADAGTIAKRLARRRGLVVTVARTYNPRDKQDKLVFRVEGAISGRDVEDIRDQMWVGVFGRAAREAFFQHAPGLGYRTFLVEVPGAAPGQRARVRKFPEKNPDEADIMADLEAWFDACTTLGEVAYKLAAKYEARLKARITRTRKHSVYDRKSLSDLLDRPIYWGHWEYAPDCDRESVVWDEDRRRERHADGEYERDVPELAWWPRERVAAWREKFAGGDWLKRRRFRGHAHPLLGVLACDGCGGVLIGNGRHGYACPIQATGRCPASVFVGEGKAMEALRAELPAVLGRAREALQDQGEADERERQAGRDDRLAEAVRSRDALLDRVEALTEQTFGPEVDPRTVSAAQRAALADAERRLEAQRTEVDALTAGVALRGRALGVVRAYVAQPERLFDAMPADEQAAFWRAMVAGARLRAAGTGRGRRVWVNREAGYAVKAEREDGTVAGGTSSSTVAYLSNLTGRLGGAAA